MRIKLLYGNGVLEAMIPGSRHVQILQPDPRDYSPDQNLLLQEALENPHASPRLRELSVGKQNALIIASDHTRPVPSKRMMPLLLEELRSGNPSIDITILIAAGCHRASTSEELMEKFGEKIVETERIVQHDAFDYANHEFLGVLPSGARLLVNSLVPKTQLLLSEGFIEPHFFAGFSGGRKSVLPGIASKESVFSNHSATFIDNPHAVAGSLLNNPIHIDMQAAAQMAKLQFIFNVILDEHKKIIAAYAGAANEAHRAGCEFLAKHAGIRGEPTPIVLTSNGGYPLDQNIYQCVKGLTTAEKMCAPGGVIILCASCLDGHGGREFYEFLKTAQSPAALLAQIRSVPTEETKPDQWQAQILAKILCEHHVIFVTTPALENTIKEMKMQYATDVHIAVKMAEEIVGKNAAITVIPDGVGTFVLQEKA